MEEDKVQLDNIRMEYVAIRDEIILLMNEQNTHITNLYIMFNCSADMKYSVPAVYKATSLTPLSSTGA